MARLICKSAPWQAPVYDVMVSGTHSFFAASGSAPRSGVLAHNSHQLSKEALDGLLKYLEDTFPGSQDKKLTCIFCTTEPERMRATILSRCAPAFVVQPQKPEVIAKRLAFICAQEGLEVDPEVLPLIAEVTECHIRDALKAIEGVSMLGVINRENVTAYLHLDLNTAYVDLLDAVGTDLGVALSKAKGIMQRVSPTTCYDKLTEVAMLAYQVSLGDTASLGFWGLETLQRLAAKGPALLGYASRFASRPGRPTAAMLLMDVAALHHSPGGMVHSPMALVQVVSPGVPVSAPARSAPAPAPTPAPAPIPASTSGQISTPGTAEVPGSGILEARDRDWIVDPRLIGTRDKGAPVPAGPRGTIDPVLSAAEFARYLAMHLAEKRWGGGGPAR